MVTPAALANVAAHSSFLSSSVFSSGWLVERSFLALSLICVEQFTAVFAPGLVQFVSFLQTLMFPEGSGELRGENLDTYEDEQDGLGDVVPGQPKAPTVLSTYSRFMDDKKPTIGTKSDLDMLKAFGYNKYRYLSKSFLKRNNMSTSKSAKKKDK